MHSEHLWQHDSTWNLLKITTLPMFTVENVCHPVLTVKPEKESTNES